MELKTHRLRIGGLFFGTTVMYRQLGHYVEAACKGDMNTFVSSGFVAAPKPVRRGAQPVDVPEIAVDLGPNTGQLDDVIKAPFSR